MTLIDLSAARERRDGPDAEHVVRIGAEKWYRFLAEYTIDGEEFGFHFWARDFADAERRLAALKATASIAGQVYAEVRGP